MTLDHEIADSYRWIKMFNDDDDDLFAAIERLVFRFSVEKIPIAS